MDSVDDSWAIARRFMERTCGVVMAEEQRYLLDARLQPVAREMGVASVAALVRSACAGEPVATTRVIDALTTHETLFFRDASFWTQLRDVVLPALLVAGRTRPLRVWSAACSTGQEPYTLQMLLAESFPSWLDRTEITATDVSAPSLDRARAGRFTSLEVNRGLGAARLVRFFEKDAGGFRVNATLRRNIVWQEHNLLGAKPDPANCDLVLCRNVLIYFSEADRRLVVGRLFRATGVGGFVGVGSTELLKQRQVGSGIYAKDPEKK